ncbi:MAG: glycosyltransferase family 4 protein [Acidobacteria bacterium]|nr:glycosyltransferase family 4 protein [Acidobacteriota bacterium]
MLSSEGYDLISIEKELLPFVPGLIESDLVLRNARYTVDYDDAMYHRYDQHPNAFLRMMLGRKISKVMAGAGAVTVGSHYILDYARQFNPNSFLIPTVVDLSLYPDAEPRVSSARPFVIGWIGSQATIQYLKSVEDALEEFCSARNARVLVIGGNPIPFRIRSMQWIPWSRENEVKWLSAIHVGIMPLPRSPWSMGKCAFKLIQYMACWKPVVASPVGENNHVVTHGVNGYLAATKEEWIEALDDLYRDPGRCLEMGRAGRRMVEERYQLNAVAPEVLDILYAASGRGDRS